MPMSQIQNSGSNISGFDFVAISKKDLLEVTSFICTVDPSMDAILKKFKDVSSLIEQIFVST